MHCSIVYMFDRFCRFQKNHPTQQHFWKTTLSESSSTSCFTCTHAQKAETFMEKTPSNDAVRHTICIQFIMLLLRSMEDGLEELWNVQGFMSWIVVKSLHVYKLPKAPLSDQPFSWPKILTTPTSFISMAIFEVCASRWTSSSSVATGFHFRDRIQMIKSHHCHSSSLFNDNQNLKRFSLDTSGFRDFLGSRQAAWSGTLSNLSANSCNRNFAFPKANFVARWEIRLWTTNALGKELVGRVFLSRTWQYIPLL